MNDAAHDLEQLELLRLFHFIYGGLCFLIALAPSFHIAMGLFMILEPGAMTNPRGDGPSPFFGWTFLLAGVMAMVILAALGVCQLIVARSLKRFQHHSFCLVIAACNCFNVPFGTALGLYTIMVLSRPAVKTLFTGLGSPSSPYRG